VVVTTRIERDLLTGHHRPIVLLPRRDGSAAEVCADVAPGNPDLGVMTPYTPLHHLLLDDRRVLVMTSGNVAGEPIVTDDDDARERLAASQTRGSPMIGRSTCPATTRWCAWSTANRSRSVAPGATHRSPCTCPSRPSRCSPSAPTSRTPSVWPPADRAGCRPTSATWTTTAPCRRSPPPSSTSRRLTGIAPAALVADAHPSYRSSAWARTHADGRPVHLVQHHHAHVASTLADNGHPGDRPVLGIAFDGTGYGTDGAVWGGEFLLADYSGARRVGPPRLRAASRR
jgi:hydrogenase maturation protein HypF